MPLHYNYHEVQFFDSNASHDSDIRALLLKARIPAPKSDASLRITIVATCDDKLIGVIRLNIYNDSGLIHSLAVDEPYRRLGIGNSLIKKITIRAAKQNIEKLFLLTDGNNNFFIDFGCQSVERNKDTEEMEKDCPSDASFMIVKVDDPTSNDGRVSISIERLNYARRCFLEPADDEYIAARLAYNSGLMLQYVWLAHQSVEKYLKYILLSNEVKATKGHDLIALCKLLGENDKTKWIEFTQKTQELIWRLNSSAPNRYLEFSYHTCKLDLVALDAAIWELRLFCNYVDLPPASEISYFANSFKKSYDSKECRKQNIDQVLAIIKKMEDNNFDPRSIQKQSISGHISNILDKGPDHPAWNGLVAGNYYFGKVGERVEPPVNRQSSQTSPQDLHGLHVYMDLGDYIKLPNDSTNYIREKRIP